jgi:hypothetical protein
MKGVRLQASGYTWSCPECEKENYTGSAPPSVICALCKAEYPVAELLHNSDRAEASQPSFFGPDGAGSEEPWLAGRGVLRETEHDQEDG